MKKALTGAEIQRRHRRKVAELKKLSRTIWTDYSFFLSELKPVSKIPQMNCTELRQKLNDLFSVYDGVYKNILYGELYEYIKKYIKKIEKNTKELSKRYPDTTGEEAKRILETIIR